MRDVSFNYRGPATSDRARGLVTITDNQLDIVIDTKSLAFDVTSAKHTPLIVTDNATRTLALQVTGRLEHMLAPASPEINLLDDLPVNLNNASGVSQPK